MVFKSDKQRDWRMMKTGGKVITAELKKIKGIILDPNAQQIESWE